MGKFKYPKDFQTLNPLFPSSERVNIYSHWHLTPLVDVNATILIALDVGVI